MSPYSHPKPTQKNSHQNFRSTYTIRESSRVLTARHARGHQIVNYRVVTLREFVRSWRKSGICYPAMVNPAQLLSRLNRFVGAVIYYSPFRAYCLRRALVAARHTLVEQAVASYFFSYRFYKDVPRYRQQIMESQIGDEWTEIYRARRDRAEQQFAVELDGLAHLIFELDAKKVMQVGCAGGGELLSLAKHFPFVEFVGIDLNRGIIAKNQHDLAHVRNLRWIAADALTGEYISRERPDLVFTSGTAEYFTESELEAFLLLLKDTGVSAVQLWEPITLMDGFDYFRNEHSAKRGMMAFSHPYGRKVQAVFSEMVETLYPAKNGNVIDIRCVGRR